MNYDRLASAISACHETYVADLRSLHMGLRMAGQLTPGALAGVVKDARRARSEFLHAADRLAAEHLGEVFGPALDERENLTRRLPFVRELAVISTGEFAQLKRKIRGAGLAGLIADAGPMARLARRLDERFEPTAQDSAGRTWKADKLVRFLARDFGYQSHIDAKMVALLADGQSQAQIVWLDPTHDHNGLVVTLPLAADLRQEFFHPNANAQLTHVPA